MEDQKWSLNCSDDECDQKTGIFEPPVAEIEKLYAILDDGKLPDLNWQCPGYRPPTPTNTPVTPVQEEQITEEKSDFDFMDDISSPKLPVRREGESGLRGSAKKKTTSLDGVISNMRRHRRLELQMLDNQQTPTTSS